MSAADPSIEGNLRKENTQPDWAEIETNHLKPGQALSCDIFDKNTVILKKGVKITQGFLDALKRRRILKVRVTSEVATDLGVEVSDSSLPEEAGEASQEEMAKERAREEELFEEAGVEISVEKALIEDLAVQVEVVFAQLAEGNLSNLDELKGKVEEMVKQVISRPNAAVKLFDIKRYDDYTYRHSVNVGLLFVAVGQDFFPPSKLEELTLGAVLHDIGKTKIPLSIVSKRGPLTESEIVILKRHPTIGRDLLEDFDGLGTDALDIVLSHHERWDGEGYPNGRGAGEISLATEVASVCNVYDSLTSTRCYESRMSFHQAVSIVVQGSDSCFSPRSVSALCKRVGIYPVGSFVLISDGSIAVVKEINPDQIMRPVVMTLYDKSANRVNPPRRVDLADTPGLVISRAITPKDLTTLTG